MSSIGLTDDFLASNKLFREAPLGARLCQEVPILSLVQRLLGIETLVDVVRHQSSSFSVLS